MPHTADDRAVLEHLHPSMKGVSEALWLYGIHEPQTTAIYLEHLDYGYNVVEIGANIGYYVLLAHGAVGETGSVLGFEPVPDNYEVLCKNVEGLRNVQVSPIVISRSSAPVEFYVSDIPNWGSLIYTDGLRMTEKITVQSTSLDEYLSADSSFNPDLIHMDIEGGEIVAIEGAWQTIALHKPNLMIEFHPFATGFDPVRAILSDLIDLGYYSCIQIDRQLDEPWIPDWVRKLRRGKSSISEVIQSIDSGKCPPNFTLLMMSPEKQAA